MAPKPGAFQSFGELGIALTMAGALGVIFVEYVWPMLEKCYYLGCF